jgi:hypothetical protein
VHQCTTKDSPSTKLLFGAFQLHSSGSATVRQGFFVCTSYGYFVRLARYLRDASGDLPIALLSPCRTTLFSSIVRTSLTSKFSMERPTLGDQLYT